VEGILIILLGYAFALLRKKAKKRDWLRVYLEFTQAVTAKKRLKNKRTAYFFLLIKAKQLTQPSQID